MQRNIFVQSCPAVLERSFIIINIMTLDGRRCVHNVYTVSRLFAVPPMIWIQNQLIGAYVGQSLTLECLSEAHPKSINYWTREAGEIIAHGKQNTYWREYKRRRRGRWEMSNNTTLVRGGGGVGRERRWKKNTERERDKTMIVRDQDDGARVNELKIQQDFFTIRRQ